MVRKAQNNDSTKKHENVIKTLKISSILLFFQFFGTHCLQIIYRATRLSWGHEHQCRITPEVPLDVEKLKCKNEKGGGEGSTKVRTIDIIQPGAPIPTSLCQAEAGQKYISKIKIYVSDDGQVSVKYDALPLTSVRPFKFVRQVYQIGTEIKNKDIVEIVKTSLKEENSASQVGSQIDTKPIFLRIRIQSEYSSRQLKQQNLDQNSIWQNLPIKYQKMIANPVNFILFRK